MEQMGLYTGQDLKEMFKVATMWLERNAVEINSLNVFPVPDGDTGTNMLLTMKAAMKEVSLCCNDSISALAEALAKGAFMGARGNSGVILAQILRGLAQGLKGKESFTTSDIAAALNLSSSLAYKAVAQPVEGTMLTVIREVTAAAQKESCNSNDLSTIMETLTEEARASVARTPSLLPVLHQAGVVDAGGQGLYVLLEGALHCLRGEEVVEITPSPLPAATVEQTEEPFYGYCTEFLVQGENLDVEEVRNKLLQIGESVIVIGDETMVRAHVHTLDPGAAISYATSIGVLHQVKVDNMQEQHRDFITQVAKPQPFPVAVVSGEGLSRIFASIGATIVPGGETMNPSVQELLRVVESVPSKTVIILPNDPDVIPAANQVQSLTEKRVAVIPTKTIPQGVAAMMAFNPEDNLEINVAVMEEALTTVCSGALTTAVRPTKWDELEIEQGNAIAFLDGNLVAAADSMFEALHKLLPQMVTEDSELITLYYGADATDAEIEEIAQSIGQRYPELKLEVVAGGQPYYNYIISVE
jgi:hypothetical protein